MDTEPGKKLAEAIKLFNNEITKILDENNVLAPDKAEQLLTDTVNQMIKELNAGEPWHITRAGLDIILLNLANYAAMEKDIYKESGKDINSASILARKGTLTKVFNYMLQQVEDLGSNKVVEGNPVG